MLEDEVQRIRLKSTILKTEDISIGTIVALMGHRDKGGDFIVEDYCFAEAPAQILPTPPPLETDRFVNDYFQSLNLIIFNIKNVYIHFWWAHIFFFF